MLISMLDKDFELINEKGVFVQLVHSGWNQINILQSLQGTTRGGHYHKENKEAFYIIEGKVKLTLEINGEVQSTVLQSGDFFMVKPFQKHLFEFLQDSIMLSMYDIGVEYEDGTKDIYQE